jgi:HSP20 family protein
MLLRFDPFREIDRIAQMTTEAARTPSSFPLDAYRRGDRFIVQFDLPGIDASSLDITVERNVLTVKGERRFQREEGDEIIVAERPQGLFVRQLLLGDALDGEHISANYQDGVLTLEIPIAQQAKPRKIQVTAGGEPRTIEAPGNGSQRESEGAPEHQPEGAGQPQPTGAPAG